MENLIAPQWLNVTEGRRVDWQDENRRLQLLASILLEQRRKQPSIHSGTRLVEIISDGIRDNEPLWHGLKVDPRVELFRPDEIESLQKRVRDNRRSIGSNLNTHFLIGRLFHRPVLLGVHQRKDRNITCYVHAGHCWEILEVAQHLPLKVRTDGQSLTDAAREIAEHLRVLHSRVLWPAFFTNMGDPVERQSLVLIHASSWRVLGVWALHSEGANLLEPHLMAAADVVRTVLHPMATLNDVFGAMVESCAEDAEQAPLPSVN